MNIIGEHGRCRGIGERKRRLEKMKDKIKTLKQIVDSAIWKLLGEFEERFMVGFITGIMMMSVILYRSFGLGFAMSASGQMHLISLDILFLLIPIGYYLLSYESNNGKRVLASLCFSILVFSFHDVSWLIETHFVKPIFQIPIADLDLAQYSYHYSKNAINIILAMVGVGHYLKVNKSFLIAFSATVLFHLINIVYKIDGYVVNPYLLIIIYLFDTIPYLFLIHRGDRKG